MAVALVVTAESSRADLIEAITNLNVTAKAEARRGYAGVNGDRYRDCHASLDVLLTELEMRTRLGLS
jgi:hypothetical protein